MLAAFLFFPVLIFFCTINRLRFNTHCYMAICDNDQRESMHENIYPGNEGPV